MEELYLKAKQLRDEIIQELNKHSITLDTTISVIQKPESGKEKEEKPIPSPISNELEIGKKRSAKEIFIEEFNRNPSKYADYTPLDVSAQEAFSLVLKKIGRDKFAELLKN